MSKKQKAKRTLQRLTSVTPYNMSGCVLLEGKHVGDGDERGRGGGGFTL